MSAYERLNTITGLRCINASQIMDEGAVTITSAPFSSSKISASDERISIQVWPAFFLTKSLRGVLSPYFDLIWTIVHGIWDAAAKTAFKWASSASLEIFAARP